MSGAQDDMFRVCTNRGFSWLKPGLALTAMLLCTGVVAAGAALWLQVMCMTNGSVEIASGVLQKARVDEMVDAVMDVAQCRAWKPAAAGLPPRRRVPRLRPAAPRGARLSGCHCYPLLEVWRSFLSQ